MLLKLSDCSLGLRLFVQRFFRLTNSYHPNITTLNSESIDSRGSKGRLQSIFSAIDINSSHSVIDIGSNHGFFSISLAKCGAFVLALEKNTPEYLYSTSLASSSSLQNISFYRMNVDLALLQSLPTVDIILCLSIFHHWVKQYGKDHALDMLRCACSKANTAFIFDSGQPEEYGTQWPNYLEFMKPSGPEWIHSFLSSLGFVDVRCLGEFPTTISSVNRSLFIAFR